MIKDSKNLSDKVRSVLKRQKKKIFAFGAAASILGAAYFGVSTKGAASLLNINAAEISAMPLVAPSLKYDMLLDTFSVNNQAILKNQTISEILEENGISGAMTTKLVSNCKGIFNTNSLQTGKEYDILTRHEGEGADWFAFQPDVYGYVLFNLKTGEVKKTELPVETREESSSGIVESTLWNTMIDNGWSMDLTDKVQDALKFVVDFHHLRDGSKFKFVYDQNYINGKQAGVGALKAAYLDTGEKQYYAFYFQDEKNKGYFDLDGRPMKKGFLKSPLKFSHISSGFNMHRLHPILKFVRPHFGTDYAAPYGTPILAVADGNVEAAEKRGGNGNYVKLRHDKIYETQYLHMQGFAKGLHKGSHVSQGQVIGYVGSTGLATGPHVCFRFWKNGQQCNHLNLNLPAPNPMEKSSLVKYTALKDPILAKLNSIPYYSAEQLAELKKQRKELAYGQP